jgi:hypothetical protein
MSNPFKFQAPEVLLADDLKLILTLLPRAQIVVGDTEAIFPVLRRLKWAVETGADYGPMTRPDQGKEAWDGPDVA